MTLRLAFGVCIPSATAAFQAPAYQVQSTPFFVKVSPIVVLVWGGSGCFAGSARRRSPPGAGGMPLGWYGGDVVFTTKSSGADVIVARPSLDRKSTRLNSSH